MTEILAESKSYTTRKEQWRKIRDAIEGEDQVKLQGQTYLPKPSGMTVGEYNNYKQRAMFYSVAERTRRGFLGLIFRQDPIVKVPDSMKEWMKSMTSDGMSFEMLSDELLGEGVTIGRFGILPDFSTDAKPNEFPHLVTYLAEDIVDWKEAMINGKKKLVLVSLRDTVGSHLDAEEEEFLDLTLVDGVYTAQRWKVVSEAGKEDLRVNLGEPATPTVRGKTLDYIPFNFINPSDMKPAISKPPFLDLVNMNMAHYRNSADYEHALYMTAQPTPWVAGVVSESMKPTSIGPSVIWYLAEGGRAGYLEFEGKGLEQQRHAMNDKEDRMAALGARMIAESANRNETVDTARLRGRGEMSLLKSVVMISSVAMTRVLRTVADWMGLPKDDILVKYNDDFVETRMTHQEMTAMVSAWQSGAISRFTMHENFQRGEIIDPARTVEEEEADIDEDVLINPAPQPQPGDEDDDTGEPPGDDET